MSTETPMPDRLRAAAETLVAQFAEANVAQLTFDLAGVRWVDGYIERNRAEFPAGQREGLVGYLAAFVGECIIRTHGGRWTLGDHGLWGVEVSPHLWACPIAKITKQFNHGATDSVASFVETIPALNAKLADGTAETCGGDV